MSETLNKDDNYWKILDSALELDVKKGHLKWTLSDLSRKSSVTRSLIYYYFGRSKTSILNEAIKLIGIELAGLNPEREQLWANGHLLASMAKARSIYDRAPYIGLFITEHISKDTELGETIRDIQNKFIGKINKFFAFDNKEKSRAIYGLYWGMLFAPMQSEDTYQYSVKALSSFIP